MATKQIFSNCTDVVAGSTTNTELIFMEGPDDVLDPNERAGIVVSVKVLTGSGIKFNCLGDASLSDWTVTTSDGEIFLTILRDHPINFKASGASDTFRVKF